MAKIRLNAQYQNGQAYIRLVYRYRIGARQIKFVYSTGRQVAADQWNPKRQEVRRSPGVEYQAINTALAGLVSHAEKVVNEYQGAGRISELTPLRLRVELDAFWQGASMQAERSLFGFFEQIVQERKESRSAATAESYQYALMRLRSYVDARRMALDFQDVDIDFLSAWVAWMRADGLGPNSVSLYVSRLKTVMAEALDRNLHTNNAFRSRRFTAETEETENVYLTESEVQALAEVKLPAGNLAQARDLFLISCYTALRFSDVGKVNADALVRQDGVELLKIEMEKRKGKRGGVVYIPVSPELRAVLDRYGWQLPEMGWPAVMNIRIRECCRRAGICSPVPGKKKSGKMRVLSTVEKWQVVSWHTARRTFATNNYLRAMAAGQSIRPIMEIGGWSKESTFLGYVKSSRLVSAVSYMKGRAALN